MAIFNHTFAIDCPGVLNGMFFWQRRVFWVRSSFIDIFPRLIFLTFGFDFFGLKDSLSDIAGGAIHKNPTQYRNAA